MERPAKVHLEADYPGHNFQFYCLLATEIKAHLFNSLWNSGANQSSVSKQDKGSVSSANM